MGRIGTEAVVDLVLEKAVLGAPPVAKHVTGADGAEHEAAQAPPSFRHALRHGVAVVDRHVDQVLDALHDHDPSGQHGGAAVGRPNHRLGSDRLARHVVAEGCAVAFVAGLEEDDARADGPTDVRRPDAEQLPSSGAAIMLEPTFAAWHDDAAEADAKQARVALLEVELANEAGELLPRDVVGERLEQARCSVEERDVVVDIRGDLTAPLIHLPLEAGSRRGALAPPRRQRREESAQHKGSQDNPGSPRVTHCNLG